VMRTIKEDLVWIYEWSSSFEFERAFNDPKFGSCRESYLCLAA